MSKLFGDYLNEILAAYLPSTPSDEVERENGWQVPQQYNSPGLEYPYKQNLVDIDGFEKILYPGRDLETLNDFEIDELEWTDYGTAVLVPEDEAEQIAFEEGENMLSERIIKKKVVRNGKRMIKFISDREGFRVDRRGGRMREVRMKPLEMRRRLRAQKVASRKRVPKSQSIHRKMNLSMKRRKGFTEM